MEEKYGIGTKHITNEGYEIEIIEKLEHPMRKIRFENGYEFVTNCSNIKKGGICNPYHPSVFGVGYYGVGEYKAKIERKNTPEYVMWHSMLQRCYSYKYQEKRPTYKNVTLCKDWHNFQNFAKWYNVNYPKIEGEKFCIDKDLLQLDVENKIYSPDTCAFIPDYVNSFLANKLSNNTSGYTGVSWYKIGKKWRSCINLFDKGKLKHLGYFTTLELASEVYQKARSIEAEKVKSYLRELNYLPEHIIQLIK